MIRNPVMFVRRGRRRAHHGDLRARSRSRHGAYLGFTFQIVLWLWVTVLFANFAEAVAEGRGKAQAATLRRARTETMAKRLASRQRGELSRRWPAPQLKQGDIVLVEAGDLIPSDGEVIEGIASVDEVGDHR